MASGSTNPLNEIYQLSDLITEAHARIAVIRYNQRKSGLAAEMMRSEQIRKLQLKIDQAELERREKIIQYYSNWKPHADSAFTPSILSSSPSFHHDPIDRSLPSPVPPSTHPESTSDHQSVENEIMNEEEKLPPRIETPSESHVSPDPTPPPSPPPAESKWSTEPMPPEEKAYYERCKQYEMITGMPIISVSEDIYDDQKKLLEASLVCVIDINASEFDEEIFLEQISNLLNIDDISIIKIQSGCVKVIFEIFKNVIDERKKIEVKAVYTSMTDKVMEELGKLRVLFMYMGDLKAFNKNLKFRNEIILSPQWNKTYDTYHTYWNGDLKDGRDRGDRPYFCPVGWKRYSFHVSNHFYEKFKGWCICYHGTKFSYGLSILLSGLTPAKVKIYGDGIYTSPSIIYTAHPRYSEVREIESDHEKTFFKKGKYVQFVLQCRVHPNNRKVIKRETLGAGSYPIDPNVSNDKIEWLINADGKSVMDFNDPNSTIVCTGLMVRITDNHPVLLPESKWWYDSHQCGDVKRCSLGLDMDNLLKQVQIGYTCSIINE